MKIYEMLTNTEQTPAHEREYTYEPTPYELDCVLEAMDQDRSIDTVLDLINELEVPGYIARSILDDVYDKE